MNQKEIISKFKSGKYIELINSIYQSYPSEILDLFLFKSKNNDTFYLGFNQANSISEKDLKNFNEPLAIVGDFETNCNYIYYDQYLFFKNGTLESKINFDFVPYNVETEDIQLKDIHYNISQDQWANMVNSSLELIHNNQFSKIVLSRDISYSFDYIDPINFLNKLLQANDYARNSFLIIKKTKDIWNISLTPELLFEMENGLIRSMSLAGSLPRSKDEQQNFDNEELLLSDEKLSLEHGIVTKELVANYESICDKYEVSPISILKLDYIQHRLQTIVGKLKTKLKVNDVIKTLHPTPAVGTMPKTNGINIINKIETRKRGFYASPCGVSYKNSAEVAVMLRSATLINNHLTLHTGCGITKGSLALNEWNETENKTMPFKRLFNQQ